LPLVTSSAEPSRRAIDAARRSIEDRRAGLRSSLINAAAALVVTILSAVILKELKSVLQPLFIAVFLFYVAGPAVDQLVRRRIPYGISYLLVLSIFAALSVAGLSLVADRVDELARRLPEFQTRLQEIAISTAGGVTEDLPFFRRHTRSFAAHLDLVKPLAGATAGFLSRLLEWLSASLLVIFYLAFLIQERRFFPKRLVSVFGPERAGRIRAAGERINSNIARYIYIKLLASALSAGLALGVMLAFGLDFALLWTAIVFVANFIPYVGSIIGFLLPIGMGVMQFTEPWKVLTLSGALIAIDLFVGNYWEPRVCGQKLNLSPVVVLFSLALWGWLWGVTGLILAVPITVSMVFVFENISYTRSLAILLAHRAPDDRPAA